MAKILSQKHPIYTNKLIEEDFHTLTEHLYYNWNPRQMSSDAYLTPGSSTSILPALLKACIPVCADEPVIQTSPVYVPHGILCVRSRIVS